VAYLNGHPNQRVVGVPMAVGAPTVGIGGPATAGSAPAMTIIDGTPVRVVVMALSAAAGLFALRMAGFKFNVGVSN
jgi:hypothetical protein